MNNITDTQIKDKPTIKEEYVNNKSIEADKSDFEQIFHRILIRARSIFFIALRLQQEFLNQTYYQLQIAAALVYANNTSSNGYFTTLSARKDKTILNFFL